MINRIEIRKVLFNNNNNNSGAISQLLSIYFSPHSEQFCNSCYPFISLLAHISVIWKIKTYSNLFCHLCINMALCKYQVWNHFICVIVNVYMIVLFYILYRAMFFNVRNIFFLMQFFAFCYGHALNKFNFDFWR